MTYHANCFAKDEANHGNGPSNLKILIVSAVLYVLVVSFLYAHAYFQM